MPRRALVTKMNGVDGSIEWEYLAPAAPVSFELTSVTVDTRDNVFAAGVDSDLPTVIKVNGMTGEVMWSYTGTAESRAVFSDVAFDDETDHVVAVGFTEGRCSVDGVGTVRIGAGSVGTCLFGELVSPPTQLDLFRLEMHKPRMVDRNEFI